VIAGAAKRRLLSGDQRIERCSPNWAIQSCRCPKMQQPGLRRCPTRADRPRSIASLPVLWGQVAGGKALTGSPAGSRTTYAGTAFRTKSDQTATHWFHTAGG
jgi:hypothetical protein